VIQKHGVKPVKVFIVRNDPEVNVNDNFQVSEVTSDKGRVKLIYVGAINQQDGVDLLVQVVNILVKRLDCKFVGCRVVGDGEGLPEVKTLVADLGLDEYFEFTGYVYDRHLITAYIHEADICLETAPDSESNRKSTFIKIMEYMACGKPIVAFDLLETRVSTGESAILVDPGDVDKFADEVFKLVNDAEQRRALGRMARQRIIDHLNWNNSSRTLRKVYSDLVDPQFKIKKLKLR